MMTRYAVINASFAVEELFCFNPVILHTSGEIKEVLEKQYFLEFAPPADVTIVGVIHEDGIKAANRWCEQHEAKLTEWGLKLRGIQV